MTTVTTNTDGKYVYTTQTGPYDDVNFEFKASIRSKHLLQPNVIPCVRLVQPIYASQSSLEA